MVPEVLRAFRPQVLVTQHGCDSHRHDPLADLDLSVDGQRASYLMLADLADELCDGRWVSAGGGGYASSTWCRGPGRICWRSSAASRCRPDTATPLAWRYQLGAYAPLSDE